MGFISVNSPVGPLTIFADDDAIVAVDWGWPPETDEPPTPLLERARDQMEAYFEGRLTQFDLPLAPHGTAFQRKVWAAIAAIPFGKVRTYGDLARDLGTAPRPLGGACGRNPIPIIIPCHRVLGMNGSLGGYSGMDGLETKEALLRHEGVPLP
ncbi:MAG: methylated-DNA--[protein]-cysteine S-methyltransferase [Magnetospirillum sp.]